MQAAALCLLWGLALAGCAAVPLPPQPQPPSLGLSGAAPPGTYARADATVDLKTDSDESQLQKRAKIRLELAVGYFSAGQTTIALDEVKQALAIDPQLAQAHSLRGSIYLKLNELVLAEESYKRALQLEPRSGAFMHNYGVLLCQTGRLPKASRWFNGALQDKNYQDRARTWLLMGTCQARAGEWAQAQASLMQAYALDSMDPTIQTQLSSVLFQAGNYPQARFYMDRLNQSAQSTAASLWLGIRIEKKMGNSEALIVLSRILRNKFAQSREYSQLQKGAFDE